MDSYTMDVEAWLRECGPRNSHDAYCIEQAVLRIGERQEGYVVEENDGLCFVRFSGSPVALCISDADALDLFLDRLRTPYAYDLDTQRYLDRQRFGRA